MENLLKSRSERVEDEDLMDLAHTFIDQFAYSISTYWALKRDMAAGSEPEYIHHLRLHLAGVCAGFSLCGAGGGGYAVAVLKRETEVHALQSKITEYNSNYVDSTVAPICTMHKSSIDFEGIRVATKVCDRTSSILEAML
jgi:fucokinase